MLVVDVVMKDNERNEMVQEDNEMDSQAEKDHPEEAEIEEVEGGGDGKPPHKPEYQYSREELLKYSDHPLSRQRPVITDPNIYNLFCWLKSSGWNNCKRSDTPTDRGDDSHKLIYPPRRITDPRERVRKEQDGIVLSPQRRSFNSGCFVTVAPNTVVRPSAESAKEGPVRRIGSGRIINRDWEFRDKENADDGYPFRVPVGPSPRERDERFDVRRNYPGMSSERELVRDVSRESLSRDKDMRPDPRVRDRDRLLPRYSIDRRRFEAEEPEWFSGGPTSQHDTIELRGFDDGSETGSRNKGKQISKSASKPNSRDSRSNAGSRKSSSEEISVAKGGGVGGGGGKKLDKDVVDSDLPAASSSPKADQSGADAQKNDGDGGVVTADDPNRTENPDFLNLEDFLQLDNLPLLTNGGGGEGNQSSSRFSQWFRRDSPSDVNDTRRSSIQDELIKNIINEATGKVTSVEELEARMRQGAGQSPATQNTQGHSKKGSSSNRKEEELIAFKKLLKQVAEGGVTAANDQFNRSPASCLLLYQMLNKPPEPSDMMGQAHQPATAPPMHVPHDLVYKLLHVQEQQRQVQQQQEFNKLLLSSGRLGPPPHVPGTLSPLPPELQVKVANSQPSAELLARPEAQAILQGLRQGEITQQHLIQQLQNPAMQPRHREVLASILKLHGNSPRPASPLVVPHDPTLLQQLMLQQQLRNPSPLPPMHNAFCQSSVISPNPLATSPIALTVQHPGLPHRVPSPRELMLHTQTIMQSALIKKKLEEQRENFRKRQELQRATSPNVSGAKSPNPSAPSTNPLSSSNVNPTSSASLSSVASNGSSGGTKTVTAVGSGVANGSDPALGSSAGSGQTTPTTTRTGSGGGGGNPTATKSPTPLAFTPTSVLRKMTADQQQQPQQPVNKDGEGNKLNKYNELFQAKLQRQNELFKATQSSRFLAGNQLLGLRSPQQQQQQPQQQPQPQQQQQPWPVQKQTLQHPVQQQGRAIVKGSNSYAPAPPLGAGLVDLPYGGNARQGVFSQRSKWTMPTVPLVQPNLYNSFPTPANRVPPNRAVRNSFPQFLPPTGGDGDLSTSPTTSNQLAHWFTPELLAQAQAQAQTRTGKSDSTLNMVSVEELERLQQNSAPVIN